MNRTDQTRYTAAAAAGNLPTDRFSFLYCPFIMLNIVFLPSGKVIATSTCTTTLTRLHLFRFSQMKFPLYCLHVIENK